MTLTPQQKIEAYTYAMLELQQCPNAAVCLLLQYWLNEWEFGYPSDLDPATSYFPEFLAQKPQGCPKSHLWWPDGAVHPRLLALERAIEMVKNNQIKLK